MVLAIPAAVVAALRPADDQHLGPGPQQGVQGSGAGGHRATVLSTEERGVAFSAEELTEIAAARTSRPIFAAGGVGTREDVATLLNAHATAVVVGTRFLTAEEAGASRSAPIEDKLHEGQEVVVQVLKEPMGTKGARITSHVSLPGRYIVLMPTVEHVGVSRKIESREERARLRGIVREFREQHGFTGGVIIRTAAAGRPPEALTADLEYFQRIWGEVRQRADSVRAIRRSG